MDTPSPLSICITNMVIVFAVLIVLAFVIQLIHIVDPTKIKRIVKQTIRIRRIQLWMAL
mgnify:CR=1 FL=1